MNEAGTQAEHIRTCAVFRHAISSTCAALRLSGPIGKLCNSLLPNCPGAHDLTRTQASVRIDVKRNNDRGIEGYSEEDRNMKRKTPEVKTSKPKITKRNPATSKKTVRTIHKPSKSSSAPVAGGELERGNSRQHAPTPTLPRRPGEGDKPSDLYHSIATILRTARTNVYRAINFTMVEAYWNVGRTIVEDEQQGESRADYGAQLMQRLSERLCTEFGKGFSVQSLWNMRQFYQYFPILSALRRELSWSHYKTLIRVESEAARHYYATEAASQNWSTRALERQINSLYYERLLMSNNKAPVVDEMREHTAQLGAQPQDFIKDPYVLEFLGIPDAHPFREADLEQAIIDKLQAFMLELGKGFAFVGRQYRVSTETKDFFIDLVFYNYILKCFVLVDLKTAELTHQDIGQMDMYVRLFEDIVKDTGDNPTVGIILCTERDHTVVKYSVLNENRQLFASRYMLYLPTEEALRAELERERALAVRERRAGYEYDHRAH